MSSRSDIELAAQLDAHLPQTQCTLCGYPRCRLYAEAMVRGEADINRCPPGGETTLQALAQLIHAAPKALDPAYGAHDSRKLAVIDEAVCIGCRKCIDACPVDAIVGAAKLMHTVIEVDCTGCGLCVAPCPVDCIALLPASVTGDVWPEYTQAESARWRDLTERRLERLERAQAARTETHASSIFPDSATIRREMRAALERVRARRRQPGSER